MYIFENDTGNSFNKPYAIFENSKTINNDNEIRFLLYYVPSEKSKH